MRTLRVRTLVFHLPAGWQAVDAQLCPRVPGLAWEVCTVPQAARGTVPLDTYVRPGAPIEIWLADRTRGFRGERVRLLTIPASAFAGGTVDLYGSDRVSSLGDAWRLARTPGALLQR